MEEKILNENNETPKDPLTQEFEKKEKLFIISRVLDFIIGSFLALLYFWLVSIILNRSVFSPDGSSIVLYFIILMTIFIRKKTYLAFGFLLIVLFPLFLFGGCLILMMSGR